MPNVVYLCLSPLQPYLPMVYFLTHFDKILQQNWAESREHSYLSLAPNPQSEPLSTTHTRAAHLTESSTHHYHPKYTDYIKVHFCVIHFIGLDKCTVIHMQHNSFVQNSFTALKILFAPCIHPSLHLITGNHWSYYPCSFFFSKMSYRWNHTVYSFCRLLLSLSNVHLKFLHVSPWLHTSFLFSTK